MLDCLNGFLDFGCVVSLEFRVVLCIECILRGCLLLNTLLKINYIGLSYCMTFLPVRSWL